VTAHLPLLFSAPKHRERAQLARPRLAQWQIDYCSATDRKLLSRGGNSIGKSYVHAWDDINFIRGTNPWRKVPKGPRFIILCGYSFAQMDPLLRMLWMLLPKDEVDSRLYYQPGNGIMGFKIPAIPFVSGPGAGGCIFLATYEQGAGRIMGAQVHRISLDEPPPEEVYAEAIPRLNAYTGELRITFTPTPESPPLDYIRQLVEEGDVREIQTDYSEEATTVLGGVIPIARKTQAEVDADIAGYTSDQREMRRTGAWTQAIKGRWLELVGDACWVASDFPRTSRFRVAVGMDHGTRPGRQSASLVVECDGIYWILDEWHPGKATTVDEDAAGILAMLRRWTIPWERVNLWVGDRATSNSFWGEAKSNRDMQRALAAQLRITSEEASRRGIKIITVRKGAKSVRRSTAQINTLASNGRLKVHTKAVGFRKAAMEWIGDPADPIKDPYDSARYALMTMFDRKDIDRPTMTDVG